MVPSSYAKRAKTAAIVGTGNKLEDGLRHPASTWMPLPQHT